MSRLSRSLCSICAGAKSRLSTLGASLETHIELVKLVFAVIAALWVLFEYRAKQEEGRVAQTLEHVKRWNTEEIAQADRKINDFIIDPVNKPKLDAAKGNKQALDDFMTDAAKAKLSTEVWKIYNFYNNVAVCVDAELCEAVSACRYFGSQMKIFLENFGAYFEEFRKSYKYDALTQIHAMLAIKACKFPKSSDWSGWLRGLVM